LKKATSTNAAFQRKSGFQILTRAWLASWQSQTPHFLLREEDTRLTGAATYFCKDLRSPDQ
jgi:hypothetical protein